MAIKTISELKTEVNQTINTNGNRGITGSTLNTAMIDTIDSLNAIDERLEERKANIDGSYDTLTVGLAKNLEGDIYVEGKTYFKPTATVISDDGAVTSEEVGSGPASIETIQGNTVVWNQLLKEGRLVDMGLPSGTLWATSNIDITQEDGFAASPFQYECSFFSWGNIDGHNPTSTTSFSPYDWGSVNDQAPWYDGQPYGTTSGSALTGNIVAGDTYDAARKNTGGLFRMPTSAEFAELVAGSIYIDATGTEIPAATTDKRVTVNGIVGLYLQSKTNGNRLFFACSGYGIGSSWRNSGVNGYYWSSSFDSSRYAQILFFNSGGVTPQFNNNRFGGFAVRAVISPSNTPTTGHINHKYIKTGNNMFDLTLMFGYGNEPSNVDDLIDYLNKNVGLAPYYAYNAGTLINAKPSGMASIGYNLMELEGSTGTARVPGKYDDGLYGSYYGIRGSYSSVSFIPAATGISQSITPDADGKFEITVPGDIVVSDAGSSTTVFMWYDGSYTEANVEYERNEYDGLDVTKIYGKANGSSTYTQVFSSGLKSFDDSRDILDLRNAEATVGVGRIDNLGAYTWVKQGNLYTTSEIVPANANMVSPAGRVLKWNQSIGISDTDISSEKGGIIFTDNRDGSYTINGTATENIDFTLPIFVINGYSHKILVTGFSGGSASTYYISAGGAGFGNWPTWRGTFEPVISVSPAKYNVGALKIYIVSGCSFATPLVIRPQMVDITLLNPTLAAKSDLTVADVEAFLGGSAAPDYYQYDSGHLGVISDVSYNDAAAFKAAMTNVPMQYKLDNPIQYTDLIVSNDGGETGVPVQVFNYTVNNWGLEELLPQNNYSETNGMATTAPILNVKYSIDAVEAINTLNDEVADLYENKANTEGYYPELSVGLADNLKGDDVVTEEFFVRTSGGEAEVANGTASLDGVKGNSVKWNQMLKEGRLVDMGLPSGTLWATSNIDITQEDGFAASPFQYGCTMFSWGNIEGHNTPASGTTFDYNWGSINAQEPYYEGQPYGETAGATLTGNIVAGDTYDAARKNTGGLFRMPTMAEFAELFDGSIYIDATGTEIPAATTNKLVTVNGIVGLYLQSKTNGNRLFFSASGDGIGSTWSGRGASGFFWTSSFYSSRNARGLNFSSGGVNLQSYNSRYVGFAVRAIVTPSTTSEVGHDNHKFCLTSNNKNIFDLTEMFGAGNEPSTVDDFEAWLAENIGVQSYYPYNTGQVLNVNMTGLESTGFNLLNPQTHTAEIPGIYTEAYDNYYGITGTYTGVTFTPAATGVAENITSDIDEEGKFELLEPGTITVTGDDSTTCVFLWWDGSQTESEPYEAPSVARIDVSHIKGVAVGGSSTEAETVFPNGMCGIGDTKDEIVAENGVAKAVKRIGARAYTSGDVDGDTMITDGTTTYYVLETPVEYTSLQYEGSEYFSNGTAVELPINYIVNNWGLERILPVNTTSAILTAKSTVTCEYATDVLETINTINDEIDNLKEEKANVKGAYPNMTVGNLISDASIPRQFYYNKTAGEGNEIGSGYASVNDIKGNTIVWNQLASNPHFTSTNYCYPVNGTIEVTNNVLTFTYSGEGSVSGVFKYVPFVKGHRYYAGCFINCPKTFIIGIGESASYANGVTDIDSVRTTPNVMSKTARIFVVSSNSNASSLLWRNNGDFSMTDCIVVDLTQMFGSGKEPSTISEFESMFPYDYYPYNAGTLISLNPTNVVSTGFNQWDEQWELGTIDLSTGNNTPTTSQIRSKNYISVIGGMSYYCKNAHWMACYDANKNIIPTPNIGGTPTSLNGTFVANTIVTFPNNCSYVRFYQVEGYGKTYNHDICINLSDPSRNGTYLPYQKEQTDLSWISGITYTPEGSTEPQQLFPNGLCSAGTVYDEVTPTKAIKRVGSVDLGTLNWSRGSKYDNNTPSTTDFYFKANLPGDFKNGDTNSYKGTCNKYTGTGNPVYVGVGNNNFILNPSMLVGAGSKLIVISDSQHTTTPTISDNWISGTTFYYELKTPIEVSINHIIEYAVQPGGTEQLLPENTPSATPTTSEIIMDVTYPLDAVGTIQNLPTNYISSESMTAFINAINTANVGFTVAMSYNSDTRKYAFTVTPTQQTT